MSAVFEFDDLPSTLISNRDDEIAESGYSSEVDITESRKIPIDEKLYEVPLDTNYISSSIISTTPSAPRKVSLDDFEILKLLGRGA